MQLSPPAPSTANTARSSAERAAGDAPLRPGLPAWSAPAVPAAPPEAETPLDLQDPLALLTVGVRIAPVDTRKMGAFVHAGWSCVCYATTAEATRRAALLAMLTYEPMAMRARHGRMQGVPLEPLLLLTQEEVERHEAASAVQAASRGQAERQSKGSVQEQLEARTNP